MLAWLSLDFRFWVSGKNGLLIIIVDSFVHFQNAIGREKGLVGDCYIYTVLINHWDIVMWFLTYESHVLTYVIAGAIRIENS